MADDSRNGTTVYSTKYVLTKGIRKYDKVRVSSTDRHHMKITGDTEEYISHADVLFTLKDAVRRGRNRVVIRMLELEIEHENLKNILAGIDRLEETDELC